MACRGGSRSQIHPGNQQNQFVRVNGFTRPIHRLQIVAWVILLIFIFIYFGVVAPAILMPWKPAAFVCVGLVLLVHLVAHLIATLKNPADVNAKAQMKQNHQLPEFDRTKHKHVIENEYCHLCETYVSKSSKHCRACNKCVKDFDHHCLWLNNCVGGHNYKYFLTTISSAFIGTLAIAAVTLFVFINTFLDFQNLEHEVWWGSPAPEVFQVFMGILIVLCLICSILLGQLLFFHLYLIHRGMTTYEYIQNSKVKKESKEIKGSENSVDITDNNDIGACSTPPTFIDTTVSVTTEGKTIVSKSQAKQSAKLETESKTSYAATHAATPDTFLATENGEPKKDSKEVRTRSEFTNAAFSAEESRNINFNSNGGFQTPSQLSVNGTVSHASSLGDLRPWDNNADPPVVMVPSPPSSRNLIRGQNGSINPDDMPSIMSHNHLHPKSGEVPAHGARRTKRKRSSKKSINISEDGLPRPLPVLPENSNPTLSHSALRKKSVLPPLKSSADWALSSEDLHSIISSQRKLPSITPSSSVNSFASYVSSNVVQSRYVENPNV